ncbi:hypothetical protein PM082_024269 [Marasmius tenuissimus]|nr:hypothetical protein PM082_024269 [Marasmius tenuissimus]
MAAKEATVVAKTTVDMVVAKIMADMVVARTMVDMAMVTAARTTTAGKTNMATMAERTTTEARIMAGRTMDTVDRTTPVTRLASGVAMVIMAARIMVIMVAKIMVIMVATVATVITNVKTRASVVATDMVMGAMAVMEVMVKEDMVITEAMEDTADMVTTSVKTRALEEVMVMVMEVMEAMEVTAMVTEAMVNMEVMEAATEGTAGDQSSSFAHYDLAIPLSFHLNAFPSSLIIMKAIFTRPKYCHTRTCLGIVLSFFLQYNIPAPACLARFRITSGHSATTTTLPARREVFFDSNPLYSASSRQTAVIAPPRRSCSGV